MAISRLYWQARTTPVELRAMLKILGSEHRISRGRGRGIAVTFERVNEAGLCEVALKGSAATVRYHTPAQAGRVVGALLSGLVKKGAPYREKASFSTVGIMLDCSRNAVMTVDHIKLWMRRLALLGYNMVMLYTEDTYELPGEPYFGYQRGAYTEKELKAIDAYAAKLNIKVIPCIQTLGHLEKILRHGAYRSVKDTSSVMLVGEKKTYRLIEKMIRQWKKVCRSDRIHIGMDETHDLGRGRYMDLHGYRRGFDLFNQHLAKVVKICKKHRLKPMIWSDMYFRLGCKSGDYYDASTVIPPDVVRRIPKAAELVYWDYYHNNVKFYLDWIKRHRVMGKEPIVGSGIWTWHKYWYDHHLTEANAGACIEGCRRAKVKEIFFTQWGDNGAYCDHDSAFAGMAYCAEKIYGATRLRQDRLEKRFAAVCGGSYSAHILAGEIHGGLTGMNPDMWADPLFETDFRAFARNSTARMAATGKWLSDLAKKLSRHRNDRAVGDLRHAHNMVHAFACRYTLYAKLLSAYRKKNKRALRTVQKEIPNVVKAIRKFADSFRAMWLRHNKPQGLETIQGRFGMIEARYREMATRLDEYISGAIDHIVELDCSCPPR